MRSLSELIDDEAPAWPQVREWIKSAQCPVEVLPVVGVNGDVALVALQVTTRSPLGAIVYRTGGILIDHGWLRLLGSGHPRLPRSLPQWNAALTGMIIEQSPRFLLIADDVVGGFFAVDGGGLGFKLGDVAYFAPDTWKWESLGMGYSQFVVWAFSGKLPTFYADYRRPGWEKDVKGLAGDRGFSISPPPGFKGDPIPRRSWKAVPLEELYRFYQDLGRQRKELPEGAQAQIRIPPPSSP